MSILAETFRALSLGVPSSRIGNHLGIDAGLAEACVDHWVRLGMVTPSGSLSIGCTSCRSSGDLPDVERPPSCFGCPFSR